MAERVLAYQAGVQERLRKAELERVKAEAEAREQKKRRRVQLALGLTLGLLLAASGGFAWWDDKQAAKRRTEAEKRIDRNAEALSGWVAACEAALRSGDSTRAKIALDEASRRIPEGGGESLMGRLERCHEDLAMLDELNAIDTFRRTLVNNLTDASPNQIEHAAQKDKDVIYGVYPDRKVLAARWRAAFEKFGVTPADMPAEESARLVTSSLIKDRLLGALDLWLISERSEGVAAILRAADRDQYRQGIRDAILAGERNKVVEWAGREEALNQPAQFAEMLGRLTGIPIARQRKVLEATLQRHPGDLALLMSLGDSYYGGNKEGAEERTRWFQAAVSAHPECIEAHNGLAIALADKDNLEGAIQEYRAAIAIGKKYASLHNNLGNALKVSRDLDGAIKEYAAAIAIDPHNATPHNGLGRARRDKGDIAGAIREFQAAIAIDSKYAAPHISLGIALAAKGETDEAIREFQSASALDPKDALPRYSLGIARTFKGDRDGAIREYQAAIALDPKLAIAHFNLGNLLNERRDFEGAIREYQAFIAIDPKFAGSHFNLGHTLMSKGDVAGAIREYRAGIALGPKWRRLITSWPLFSRSVANPSRPSKFYAAALKLSPGSSTLSATISLAMHV